MAVERRAGAPQLIEWTGERFVPWTDDVQVAYEHYHRYLWANQLTKGRRVLDLGSGEGFGSALLAGEAASVDGIDIAARAVEHSQLNYRSPNLAFHVGSALDLGVFAADAFDVVVAFEVLEHLVEQARMLAEIERVLAPDGLLVMSTPDRRMYSESTGQDNPFHELELSEAEFRALLGERFEHVALWGQRTMCGSRMGSLDEGAAERPLTLFLERADRDWRQAGEPAPMYLVAVASRAPFAMPPAESTLVDHGIQLVRESERHAVLAKADLAATQSELAATQSELAATQSQVAAEQAATESARDVIRSMSESASRTGELHREEVRTLSGQLGEAVRDVTLVRGELADARRQIERVDASVAWSAFQFVRWRIYSAIGEHSIAARGLQRCLRGVGRLRSSRRAPSAPAGTLAPTVQIRFPLGTTPLVSIVIPVHTGAALTRRCLLAIAASTDAPPYEVIVVDDAGDADNLALWSELQGARVIVNEENLGYLRSVNRGATEARGRYVLTLNNDTEVQPGWLAALVQRAESAADIGIVVPKLLYPDGSLQEAGGIIFSDGTGWNYGRGLDPTAATFGHTREVDYGSGACMLIRTDLWRDLGGYDARYEPMYYEDADLCFAARDRGFRVVYEPAAHVVHVEGGSAGTDLGSGGKRYQELNRPKFVEKWHDAIVAEQLAPSPKNVRRASDRNRGMHVLVIDHKVPLPDRDAGSLRMLHLLSLLVDIGCRVTFIPDNLAGVQPYTENLQKLGIEVLHGPVDVGLEIASIGPYLQLAILSRPVVAARYADIVREHAQDATLAYDTVDLHFVREERRAALGDGNTVKAATLRELELGLVRGADVTITVTDEEREIVVAHVPDARVVVIPVVNAIAETVEPPAERAGVLFVGGFEHPPNAGAVLALVRDVMPIVWRELGPVAVRIVGSQPPPEILALAGPDVEVAGWVKDLAPLYAQSRVMVAPLRYGAGLKGKVTQSLAAGLPVVTTPIGAEGLDAVDGRDMLIATDPADLAGAIVKLLGDDELWSELSRNGQELAARVFSPEIARERLEGLLGVSVASP